MSLAILREIDALLIVNSIDRVTMKQAQILKRARGHMEQKNASDGDPMDGLLLAILNKASAFGEEKQLTSAVDGLLQKWPDLLPIEIALAQRGLGLALREEMNGVLNAAELAAWSAGLRRLCQRLAAGTDLPTA